MRVRVLIVAGMWFAAQAVASAASTYYVDAKTGSDAQDGLAPEKAWKTVEKASAMTYTSGNQLLLKKDCVFQGSLVISKAAGTEAAPVIIDSYGEGAMPVIDASATGPGIFLGSSNFIEVNNLEIISDAATAEPKKKGATQPSSKKSGKNAAASKPASSKPAWMGSHYGVILNAKPKETVQHTVLRGLYIHDIFNNTSTPAQGISVGTLKSGWRADGLVIENCRIELTQQRAVSMYGATNVRIENNRLKDIGGPGIQPWQTRNLIIRGNYVDGSGAKVDPRQFGRGSCAWVIGCTDVMVEHNVFMNAYGVMDSCGFHIDMNNKNVVVQYNLSANNAGGFVEILGKNRNCAYRYNISVNDGWRVKGKDRNLKVIPMPKDKRSPDAPARDYGHLLWTSGYNGKNPPHIPEGPYDSYIYNNTMYVKEDILTTFDFSSTTDGLLIANNIFQIMGETKETIGFQKQQGEASSDQKIQNVVFKNNLYNRAGVIPEELSIQDSAPIIGEAGFAKAGGLKAEDYVPTNVAEVKNKGIAIEKLPGDDVGLAIGLAVDKDFFGNPVGQTPSLGAVEPKAE